MVLGSTVDDLPLTWNLVVLVTSVVCGTAWLTWFIRDQLSKQVHLFYRIISKHNREDDDRFEDLNTHIWNIRNHLSAQGGTPLPEFRPLPRRRYLIDDDEIDEQRKSS